jgi:predicted regulator of Ras-like GTPase activity (Roadblock/LC7/MglB family)
MTQLDEALQALRAHEGVQHVLLIGTDGLLVRHVGGSDGPDPDRVAARVPVLATAADALGRATGGGGASTAVLELGETVAIITSLSRDLLLTVLVRSGVGFAGLLREIRRDRVRLAGLV